MKRSHKVMLAFATILAAAGVLFSAALFTRVSDQQHRFADQQKRLDRQGSNICKVQGVTFAVGLANLGLALQEAKYLSTHVHNEEIRAYYRKVTPALEATLDATFKKPPKCGQKFEFTIQIEGEKTRHVETPGRRP